MREVALDTETTGLDHRTGDRVVEIGCVELINHIPSGETWHEYINPERDMPTTAFEVHGLSQEFLSDKPLFVNLADSFLNFIGDSILVIHNASFDIGFLNAELEAVDRPLISMDRVVDTLGLARRKHPGSPANLDALCRRYQIDISARNKHGALLDSEILAKVYAELIGGHQAWLEFKSDRHGDHKNAISNSQVNMRPRPLVSRLTSEERELHQQFISNLSDKPLWDLYRDN
jgi:DNA polymerase-3 subunit epsilon